MMIKELKFRKPAPGVATAAEISALENKLGCRLPPAFHEFCFRWNGGLLSKENNCYKVPASFTDFYQKYFFGKKTHGVAVLIQTLFSANTESTSLNLMKAYELAGGSANGFIPLGSNLMGDLLILKKASPMGPVCWIDPDTLEMPEGIEWGAIPGNPDARLSQMPIAGSLEAFYNALTSDPDDVD